MPKNAKVFLVEDYQDLRKVAKSWIEDAGHKVVLEASQKEEALGKVESAKAMGVNVGVVDGSLGGGPTDGPQIADALKKAIPEIKIVSFSANSVNWGDANPLKPNDVINLGKIITEL